MSGGGAAACPGGGDPTDANTHVPSIAAGDVPRTADAQRHDVDIVVITADAQGCAVGVQRHADGVDRLEQGRGESLPALADSIRWAPPVSPIYRLAATGPRQPAAITVTHLVTGLESSMTVPKMMLASG